MFEILDSNEDKPLPKRVNSPTIVIREPGIEHDKRPIAIEFKNVWFRYPTRPHEWVLQDFSLKVYEDESIGLVGQSGCGKSTLTQLLLRFYDPEDGQIFINGIDILDYNLPELRSMMGFVMQEPALLNCSIKDNILVGNNFARNSDIFKATQMSNALEFIWTFSSPQTLFEK